ncbi:non-ribosomal peptide synthetase [Legionella maceachernii]|uniref:Non-ribosomal peptide synthetase n=2 Tax=Legionella maceachernii TaxID=466 RepID=A0A0W0VXG4_9GAMM|nr:amino acid adenylation domain-containing protein [Legionella maceachernii]KTD24669.1 non-ribosomal peptide synthetase [Legionella maceachernii]SKA26598.1 amino acid adenylation domain-containing protein [Legionella maceachernii]SUP01868.1 Linear gramicidin synthase subunit B [Legionella maceachernii]
MDSSISVGERHKILKEWNQTESQYPHKIISKLFEDQAKKKSHQIALIYKSHTLLYEDLNHQANQLAHYLREVGIKRNTLVAICIEPGFKLLISILAILKAGGAYIPLDPNNPVQRQKMILSDSGTEIIITHSQLTDQFEELPIPQKIYWDAIQSKLAFYSTANPKPINTMNDLTYVCYTSGSTGKPKGVMITHQNVQHFVHWFSKAIPITSEGIFDFSSSISFDFSVACTLFPLLTGMKVAICSETDKKDPYLYLSHLQKTHTSIAKLTPSYFRKIKSIVLNENKTLDLKYLVFGGETLFARDIKDWLKKFPEQKLFCEYGPTEATVASSGIIIDSNNINHYKYRIPIGKPVLNTKLFILDKNRQPVPIGTLGELYIGGDGIAKGYLNQKKLTQKKFIDSPFSSGKLYKTGDLCRYLPDGNIEFVERQDHQIKIRGFRVETHEIEKCLLSHPGIQNVIIRSRFENKKFEEKQLVAYCISKGSIAIDTNELRDYLKKQLPDYMVPAFFVFLDEFPLSASGKLDIHKLPEPDIKETRQIIKPRNEMENILKTIWSETLNVKEISINDNFFDLGGNSLSAIRLIVKIRKITRKNIQLQDLYNAGTISELSNIVMESTDISEDNNKKNTPTDLKEIPLNELQFLFWLMRLFYPKSKVSNIVIRKRLAGNLDKNKLAIIFELLCKNHPILCYRIAKYSPLQYPQEKIRQFEVIEKDISGLKPQEQETKLHLSLNNLENQKWRNGLPLITIKLFRMADNLSELQIALSHFISDEISANIVLNEMSNAYVEYKKDLEPIVQQELVFRDYVLHEQKVLRKTLSKNINFWDEYLKDIPMLIFPIEQRLNGINLSCTSYFEIAENTVEKLHLICKKNRLSMADILLAATGYTLTNYLNHSNKTIIINFVKSTRDCEIYDNAVGLFVRNEVIKIDLNKSLSLFEVAQQIQRDRIENNSHQSCPAIIKISSILKKNWKNKKIGNFFIQLFAKIYSTVFYKHQLNYEILLMFGRVFLSRKNNHFFVNVNIMNNFIHNDYEKEFFGFKQKPYVLYKGDKLVEKNVLNVWFNRDEKGKPYLILSGSLKPEFRNTLGSNLLKIITSYTLQDTLES